jgi:small GTP-binding protein
MTSKDATAAAAAKTEDYNSDANSDDWSSSSSRSSNSGSYDYDEVDDDNENIKRINELTNKEVTGYGMLPVTPRESMVSDAETSSTVPLYQFKTYEVTNNNRYARVDGLTSTEAEDEVPRLKITIVGAANVGKTWMLQRFGARAEFPKEAHRQITVRSDFIDLPLLTRHPQYDRKLHVQLWDTPGQMEYSNITKNSLRMTHGVMLMFDAANTASFDALLGWRETISASCSESILMLVATRADTYDATVRLWVKANLAGLAHDLKCEAGYAVCSAKTDSFEKIDSVFIRTIDAAYDHVRELELAEGNGEAHALTPAKYDTVDLTQSPRKDTSNTVVIGSKKGYRCLV